MISIIIPSRVGEKIDSIKSIENQTFKDLEIIIEYDYLKEGAAKMRNKGAKNAQGEYLFFCDNDIELESDALESLYNALQNKDAGWSFGKFYFNGVLMNQGRELPKPDITDMDLIDYCTSISTMSLIRKECFLGFDEELKRFIDWDLWIRMIKNKMMPVFIDKVLFKTDVKPNSISGDNSNIDLSYKILKNKHL